MLSYTQMNPEIIHLIESRTRTTIDQAVPVNGGFTDAEKYIITDSTHHALFIKMANVALNPAEEIVLDTEAHMYKLVARYPQLQRHFPRMHEYIQQDPYRVLVLDYLAGVSWGGPWNKHIITRIHQALSDIHHVQLSQEDAATVAHKAYTLLVTLAQTNPNTFGSERRRQLVQIAWDSKTGTLTNSRGKTYWRAEPALGESIIQTAALTPQDISSLTVADVNFGNIGFSSEQAYIVDPVYMTLGNPASDMVSLGINILRDLPLHHNELRHYTKQLFVTDKTALADLLTYWIACTALPYEPSMEPWMDFQQSCGETALAVWQELYGLPHEVV